LIWDAWESLEPMQRQHWLGSLLVSAYLARPREGRLAPFRLQCRAEGRAKGAATIPKPPDPTSGFSRCDVGVGRERHEGDSPDWRRRASR
jgi:hypothetical protein